MMDLRQFDVMTFDCYGTLIDWESGIAAAIGEILVTHGVTLSRDELLEMYAGLESEVEAGEYRLYRDVLAAVVRRFGAELGFEPTDAECNALAESIREWLPFPDTVGALMVLKRTHKLGIISNVDDELFAHSSGHLQVEFDWVITAQQVGMYKPAPEVFERAQEIIGVPRHRIVHVAQSLYHDHVPAKELGMTTVWVNRRMGLRGGGATPAAAPVRPDVEVRTLGELAGLTGAGTH